jgi:hypothetical protein
MMLRTEAAVAKARAAIEAFAVFRAAIGEFNCEEFDVRGITWGEQVDLHHATALTKVLEEGEEAAAVQLDWIYNARRDIEACGRQQEAEREKLRAIVREVLAEANGSSRSAEMKIVFDEVQKP